MSVRIRLTRMGRRNRPYYRIGAFDNRTRRDGKAIEYLGHYDPVNPKDEERVHLEEERIRHWLSVGAVPTETTRSLLRKEGILKRWHDIRQGTADTTAPEEAEASEE